jgi:2-polyprenyl-6-methoxyphenol hydroxylase-like FAD-dependent oxidoreductase
LQGAAWGIDSETLQEAAMHQLTGNRAVILGASMAGLLTARVLAEAYSDVVLVDRDHLPIEARHRRGVPQSRHAHGLLARGQLALEELFPGLTDELTGRGAPCGDMLASTRTFFSGHRLRPGPSGVVVLQASRPLIESVVRARVLGLPAVTTREDCDVVGLATSKGRVSGARVRPRHAGGSEQTLEADLVVDATGRGSRTPRWLEQLGYSPAPVTSVPIGLGYASRTYRFVPGMLGGEQGIIHGPTSDSPRGAALIHMEDDQLLLTLYGFLGDHPPTDPAGFDQFAANLLFPDVREVLVDAQPLDSPVAFRYPSAARHRYEELRRFPDGLLVVGDAICSFNPIYGQGMSVAALEALALRDQIREHGSVRPGLFFRSAGRIVAVPWNLATGADLALGGVPGRRTLQMRLLSRYVSRLHAHAALDHELGAAFVRVAGLVDPPSSLLAPRLASRVLLPVPRPQRPVSRGARQPPTSRTGRRSPSLPDAQAGSAPSGTRPTMGGRQHLSAAPPETEPRSSSR